MEHNNVKINKDILSLENAIRRDFPELIKYIVEMPFKISYPIDSEIDIKNLNDYYNSLKELMEHYALTHKK
jgi:hypothetical protein